MPTDRLKGKPVFPCRVTGCSRSAHAESWSPYCNTHRLRLRRYGHPEQSPISNPEIAPYEMQVRSGLQRLTPDQRTRLDERMARAVALLLTGCREPKENKHAKQAAEMLGRTLGSGKVDPKKIVIRLTALVLLWQARPRAFEDDQAFRFIAVRHVRRAGRDYDREYWSEKEGRTRRRLHQAVHTRVMQFAGTYLFDALSPLLAALSHVARQRVELLREEKALMAELDTEIRTRLAYRITETREALAFVRALKRKVAQQDAPLTCAYTCQERAVGGTALD